MGLLIKRVLLRNAVTLAASTTEDTLGVLIRGARAAWFEIRATDAGQLQSNSTPQVTLDGTNWVNTTASNGLTGFTSATQTGIITTALNTGGVTCPLRFCDWGTGESTFTFARPLAVRYRAQATTNPITGLTVICFVAYDSDGDTRTVSLGVSGGAVVNDFGPNA